MERIANYGQVCYRIRGVRRPALIGIEGFTGSGKSYLADALGKDLKSLVVHTDKYVIGQDESLPYPDRLDHARIASIVNSSTSEASLTIIEGICLREILHRSNVRVDLFVYIKRISDNGLWHDGIDLETKREIAKNQGEPHRSDFAYHAAERPHEQADVIFERIEQDAES